MMLFRLLVLTSLLTLAFAHSAFAKKVNLEWKEIKGAAEYEIQIQKGEKTVLTKRVNDTSWSGPLEFGVYAYQIRAYDKVKRAGAWSSLKPLVVMPSPPELVSPDGGKIVFYGKDSKALFKWKLVEGATKYLVEVKVDDQSVYNEKVEATSVEIAHLKPGSYKWRVTAIIEAGDRTPASFAGKKWQSKPSDTNSFKMVQEKLDAPDLIFPKGDLKPPSNGKLEFKWKPVAGAEAYELRYFPLASPVADSGTVVTTKGTSLTADFNSEGRYRWQVRALASIDSTTNTPDAVGPRSETDFDLDRNADFLQGSGYVAISTMFAPYTYSVSTAQGNQSGETYSGSSYGLTGRLSGEYWIKPQFGVAASYEHTLYEVDGISAGRDDKEIDFKYRVNVSKDKYAWFFSPKMGFLARDYGIFLPQSSGGNDGGGGSSNNSNSVQQLNTTAYGPTLGFDLRKQLFEKFSLGLKFAYFYPISASSGGQGIFLSRGHDDGDNRNFGLGLQGIYWVQKHWSLGAGVLIEKRSITVGNGQSYADVTMDGSYFFGSVIYSFGN
jgi:hypothetical protein